MEYINILHLSDLHIGNFKYDDPETLAINIKIVLEDQNKGVDLIVFTGDIFDGRSTERKKDLNAAVKFFEDVILHINESRLSDVPLTKDDIIFVPGNHDLVRSDTNKFEKYDEFLKSFYPIGQSAKTIIIDEYNLIYDFPEKKIAILGFNSCKIKTETIKENDLKWINKLDLSTFGGQEAAIRATIKADREKEVKWDDFGYIEPKELNDVFTTFKNQIKDFSDYNLIALFHHHFYPFPEVINGKPDASFIRNYTDVMNHFQRNGVRLVLHGHKHLSIQRAVTDHKYFENPDSIIYVLSAGSVGAADVSNPSFQWVRFFDKYHNRLAEGEKYDYKDQQLETVKKFIIPPLGAEEKSLSSNLLENLITDDPKLYKEYDKVTNTFEQIILDNKINHIIDAIGRLFTVFNDIKLELRTKPLINYLILLTLNYRVIALRNHFHPDSKLKDLLDKIKEVLKNRLDYEFAESMIEFISAIHTDDIERRYPKIIKNISASNKKIGAYCSIALFLTDLFLNISDYGEFYFLDEKLNHKINIKLNSGLFYNEIPSDSLSITGDVERRAITINFKSKNPTVHKVAVLIVKDFEMRLDKFEDSLKEIKLKLYYIVPKVQAANYDLENFHFDAYIPTLLPLLTGDNLYKSKEVFIRELVQNAIDATLFRKQLQPNKLFDTHIDLEFGTKSRNGNKVKYLKITDHGTGMSKFTIERYFTSIGRSFYVSEEFDEMKKDKKIQYNAISNFGIGFLSCFMVCQEIGVKTKNILHNDGDQGLEIEIPNYDGCFFIRKSNGIEYGTEIILYEDDRKLFDFSKFVAYIKETFVGLPVPITIKTGAGKSPKLKIEAFRKQKEMLAEVRKSGHLLFFIPFSEKEKKVLDLSWLDLISGKNGSDNPYGIWFDFDNILDRGALDDHLLVSNQGLKVSSPLIPNRLNYKDFSPKCFVNYPSSFIQLDVARENILKFNDQVNFDDLTSALRSQVFQFLKDVKKGNQGPIKLGRIHNMQLLLSGAKGSEFIGIDWPLNFLFKIALSSTHITISIVDRSEIEDQNAIYLDVFDEAKMSRLVRFLQSNNVKKNHWKDIEEIIIKEFPGDEGFLKFERQYHNNFQHYLHSRYNRIFHSRKNPLSLKNKEEFKDSFIYNDFSAALYLKEWPERELIPSDKFTPELFNYSETHLKSYFIFLLHGVNKETNARFKDYFLEALFLIKATAFEYHSTDDYRNFGLTVTARELGLNDLNLDVLNKVKISFPSTNHN